jgi:hypothetical protein
MKKGPTMTQSFKRAITLFLLLVPMCCSKPQGANDSNGSASSASSESHQTVQTSSTSNFKPLLNRIWKVSNSPYGPAAGSIYVFLENGTLLETSCVETYRIALWSVDKTQPNTMTVVEDGQPVFTATPGESTGQILRLQQKMIRGGESRDITLSAAETEFVCPDIRK